MPDCYAILNTAGFHGELEKLAEAGHGEIVIKIEPKALTFSYTSVVYADTPEKAKLAQEFKRLASEGYGCITITPTSKLMRYEYTQSVKVST